MAALRIEAATGGNPLFARLGKRMAGMSAALVREVVAREARVAVERELRATIEKMARTPKCAALSAEERVDGRLKRELDDGADETPGALS